MNNWQEKYKQMLSEADNQEATFDLDEADNVLYFVLELFKKALNGDQDSQDAIMYIKNVAGKKLKIMDVDAFKKSQVVDNQDKDNRITGLTRYFTDILTLIKKHNKNATTQSSSGKSK
jgi:hypothetical protein